MCAWLSLKLSVYVHFAAVDRQLLAESFWWGELEMELRRLDWVDYSFREIGDRELCMQKIEEVRSQTLYQHNCCEKDCQRRGKYSIKIFVWVALSSNPVGYKFKFIICIVGNCNQASTKQGEGNDIAGVNRLVDGLSKKNRKPACKQVEK